VVHRTATFPAIPGAPATPWDGNPCGLMGDLISEQLVIIPYDDNQLSRLAGELAVLTDAVLNQELAGDPTLEMVGPFADGDANTTNIATRRSTYLPFVMVNMFLGTRLTPRQAWERSFACATANNMADQVRPFLDYLKAGLTRAAANQPSRVSQNWPHLDHPATPALVGFFRTLVARDLPEAFTHGNPAGATAIAAEIGNLVAETRQSRQDAQDQRALRAQGATIHEAFGDVGVTQLMRLCQVNDSGLLPGICAELSRAPKKQRQAVLQDSVTAAARNLEIHHPVFVPPGFVDKVMNREWSAPDPDDLAEGINPFLFGQPTPSEEMQMRRSMQLRELVCSGTAAPSLSDAQILTAPITVKLPLTLDSAKCTLENFYVVAHVLLGPGHVVTTAVNDLKIAITRQAHVLTWHHEPHLPALFVRHLQRRLTFWAANQLGHPAAVAWPGNQVIDAAAMGGMSWKTPIPGTHLQTRVIAPGPSAAGTGGGGTARTQPDAVPAAAGDDQRMVSREGGPPAFFNDIARRGVAARAIKRRIRDGAIQAPLDANGSPRCLAWAVKGICNTRCGQSSDHRTNHTEAEEQQLHDWCVTNFTAA